MCVGSVFAALPLLLSPLLHTIPMSSTMIGVMPQLSDEVDIRYPAKKKNRKAQLHEMTSTLAETTTHSASLAMIECADR